jgi:hypothetical protein
MPKPLFGDNGSGMHCHQSLWKGEKPLFAGDGYAGLSDTAKYYIGGLLKHAAAVVSFAAPTTNSYKRLVPGFEAPVNLAYSARNRSAAIRIPMFSTNPKLKRLEFRPPDPSCNAYLAFSAMLLAGLDGIQNRIDPGDPLEKDIYDLSPEELKDVPTLPGSLDDSLKALEADHDFLLKGDVFSPRLIERWINYKRDREINPMRMRPHPLEFSLERCRTPATISGSLSFASGKRSAHGSESRASRASRTPPSSRRAEARKSTARCASCAWWRPTKSNRLLFGRARATCREIWSFFGRNTSPRSRRTTRRSS